MLSQHSNTNIENDTATGKSNEKSIIRTMIAALASGNGIKLVDNYIAILTSWVEP
jgi:hypothetical protein